MAVVVPEGVVANSSGAHVKIREMLLEQGLWCVASLPGGVFNPYAGVKTDILFLDKVTAAKSKDVLFVKIENDGRDLGAQRRPIDKNDIPEALRVIHTWREHVLKSTPAADSALATIVPKEQIASSADRGLSVGRYRPETAEVVHHDDPSVILTEVLAIEGEIIQRGNALLAHLKKENETMADKTAR
jgi:type I restriction enzyme M protein